MNKQPNLQYLEKPAPPQEVSEAVYELHERIETSQEAALHVISDYVEEVYPDDQNRVKELLQKSLRVHDYVNIFAGNVLPKEALDTAMLHTMDMDAAAHDNLRPVMCTATAKLEYVTSPLTHTRTAGYVPALLNDMRYINGAAQHYLKDEVYQGHINGNGGGWDKSVKPVSIEKMVEMAEQVNIESALLKSAMCLEELVEQVNHALETNGAKPDDDVAILEHVIEAETFYGPLCEVLGFDGLAMELRSQAQQLRFIYQGRGDMVINAHRYLDEVEAYAPTAFLREMVQDGEEMAISSAVNEPNEEVCDAARAVPYKSAQLGEFSLRLESGCVVAGNWRVKSVGSLTAKLLRGKGDMPMDILGGTVISETLDDMARDFAEMTVRAVNNPHLAMQKAPSKEKPVIVQGEQEYIDAACAHLPEEFVTQYVQKIHKDGFRVAKFTCLGADGELPVELQFLTKKDRRDARRGERAHILYKFETDGNFYTREERKAAADLLEKLYQRKQYMLRHGKELIVNPESLIRGEDDAQTWYMLDQLRDQSR